MDQGNQNSQNPPPTLTSANVPILNFVATHCLTDPLTVLPLPQPNPDTLASREILYDAPLVNDARSLLANRDQELAMQLATALSKTRPIQVTPGTNLPQTSLPVLLNEVLKLHPTAFQGQAISFPPFPPQTTNLSSEPQSIQGTIPPLAPSNISQSVAPSNVGSNVISKGPPKKKKRGELDWLERDNKNLAKYDQRFDKPSKAIPDDAQSYRAKLDSFACDLSERVKSRRNFSKAGYKESGEDSDVGDDMLALPQDDGSTPSKKSKHFKAITAAQPKSGGFYHVNLSDITGTLATKSFGECMENVLDEVIGGEESVADLTEMLLHKKSGNAGEDWNITEATEFEEMEITDPHLALIPKNLLSRLTVESCKLHHEKSAASLASENLLKLLTILAYNSRRGMRISLQNIALRHDGDSSVEREPFLDHVSHSIDATLTILSILTSPDLSKHLYTDEVVEFAVGVVKHQLSTLIFPAYDPLYRTDQDATTYAASKSKRSKSISNSAPFKWLDKAANQVYYRLVDCISLLSELVWIPHLGRLSDSLLIQLTAISVLPFFVENLPECQLAALKLVTAVFARHDCHRSLILEDILSNIAKLPSSKRNLRSYRLISSIPEDSVIDSVSASALPSNGTDDLIVTQSTQIQMVSALLMQLLHCQIKIPEDQSGSGAVTNTDDAAPPSTNPQADNDDILTASYEGCRRSAYSFLSVFLSKCTSSRTGEEDLRPVFDCFVSDLIASLGQPEWPAAEVLVSLLSNLLIHNFSSTTADVGVRTSCLDYFGTLLAGLRRRIRQSENGAVKRSLVALNTRWSLLEDASNLAVVFDNSSQEVDDLTDEQLRQLAEKGIMMHLGRLDGGGPVLAQSFWIATWFHEAVMDAQKRIKSCDVGQDETLTVLERCENRKTHLLDLLVASARGQRRGAKQARVTWHEACMCVAWLNRDRPLFTSFDAYVSKVLTLMSDPTIAIRAKAVKCLSTCVETDSTILATKLVKATVHACLLDSSPQVRESAVEILGKFMLSQAGLVSDYYGMLCERLLDAGVSVRRRVIRILKEVASTPTSGVDIADLMGRLVSRVSDDDETTVQRLATDVCASLWFQPSPSAAIQTKVTLLIEVACTHSDIMPKLEKLIDSLLNTHGDDSSRKASKKACRQLVDGLVGYLLQSEKKNSTLNSKNVPPTLPEEKENTNSEGASTPPQSVSPPTAHQLVACHGLINAFAKKTPVLVVKHTLALQPYLNLTPSTKSDYVVMARTAETLALVLPLMESASPHFLAQCEEDLMRAALRHGAPVLDAAVLCLANLVNLVSKNYPLIIDCFHKFCKMLSKFLMSSRQNNSSSAPAMAKHKPHLLRALYTVGLLCKHFDLTSLKIQSLLTAVPNCNGGSVLDDILAMYLHFCSSNDHVVRLKALEGLGFMLTRSHHFMLGDGVKLLYTDILCDPLSTPTSATSSGGVAANLKVQVLQNIFDYLCEEDSSQQKDLEKKAKDLDTAAFGGTDEVNPHPVGILEKFGDDETALLDGGLTVNLKEMNDLQNGMASAIVQVYLDQVLASLFQHSVLVRRAASKVIQQIVSQGLIHPLRCMPALIAGSTDHDANVRSGSLAQLKLVDQRHSGFLHMAIGRGFRLAYRLQTLIQQDLLAEPIRGIVCVDASSSSDNSQSLESSQKSADKQNSANGPSSMVRQASLAGVYSLLRTSRQHRRTFIATLLRLFDNVRIDGASIKNSLTLSTASFSSTKDVEKNAVSLCELVFVADTLVYLPFVSQDEILHVLHLVDQKVSVVGSNFIQTFKDMLTCPASAEDLDIDVDAILSRIPPLEDDLAFGPLKKHVDNNWAGCYMLALVRRALHQQYGITEAKLRQYEESGAKNVNRAYDRGIVARRDPNFDPEFALNRLRKVRTNVDVDFDIDPQRLLAMRYVDLATLLDDRVDFDSTTVNSDFVTQVETADQVGYRCSVIEVDDSGSNSTFAGSEAEASSHQPHHHPKKLKLLIKKLPTTPSNPAAPKASKKQTGGKKKAASKAKLKRKNPWDEGDDDLDDPSSPSEDEFADYN